MIGTASLSLSEERLWRAEQAGDGAAPFIECPRAFALVRRLRGPLDVAVLAEVLTELLLRHEVLRSRFLACADGTPMRIIDPPHAVAVPVTDLEPGSDDAVVGRAVAEEIARPIDLTAGLLLRARLLRLADADHVLVIVIHHIVFDGWSCHVFWGEFSAAYPARLTGQPVALPPAPRYVDYVAAQRKWLGSESARLSRQYWAKRLRGAQPSTLPGDREAPAAPTTESGCERFLIAPAEADRLRRFGRDYGAVPAITATALLLLLLHLRTDAEDLLVGSPIADRSYSGFDAAVGLFLNLALLRVDFSSDPTFVELLGRVRRTCLEAYGHSQLPYDLIRVPLPDGASAEAPVPRIICNAITTRPTPRLGDLVAEPVDMKWATPSHADVSIHLLDTGEKMMGHVLYKSAMYSQPYVQDFIRQLVALVPQVVDNPTRRLSHYAAVVACA